MNTKSLYITMHEPTVGGLIVSMGLMTILKEKIHKVAFFRPIIKSESPKDGDIEFMLNYFNLDIAYKKTYGLTVKEVESKIASGNQHELFEELIDHFKTLERQYDFILCQGINHNEFNVSLDFDINLEIAKNIGSPCINIISGKNKDLRDILEEIRLEEKNISGVGCTHFATFINRLSSNVFEDFNTMQDKQNLSKIPIFALPEVKDLDLPTVAEVKRALNCELLVGEEKDLMRVVKRTLLSAMTIENFLDRLEDGDLVIAPGDRMEIALAAIIANYSESFPNIAGIIINGGFSLKNSPTLKLLKSFKKYNNTPVLSYNGNSYDTAVLVDHIPARITPQSKRKIALTLGMFAKHINQDLIIKQIGTTTTSSITPIMFEYGLFEKARRQRKTIVLPESDDERILRATEILLRRHVVDIVLLGNVEEVSSRANALGLDIKEATIIDPQTSPLKEKFIEEFYELRKAKGLTLAAAKDTLEITSYFATMMVHLGYADGMVSGAVNTTADTIRPALQIIKTLPNISIVSSLFFMCLDTKVLVYGDCAVNQDPNAEQLAQIAISSANTAKLFGIEPRIAMLSYSTGSSGSGQEVEKVRAATKIIQEIEPTLLVEGPIQYDAAIDEQVAKQKLPNSKVAGRATIFIFPDLNTGNNTYKAVQRSSNALAIGPVLQGLKKPINDLSRGCLVDDIVNTVAITAIQAQGVKS